MKIAVLVLIVFAAAGAQAQWTVQESHTTASLRGIHSVGNGVAWASGTGGTVLRTVDLGRTWTKCATPDGAEKLDFRGVQAFDARTAVVMSSGTGDASRLYKTVDGCRTWKLVLRNPDSQGFFDAMTFEANVWGIAPGGSPRDARSHTGFVLGDPVEGKFVLFQTRDMGDTWMRWKNDSQEQPALALAKDGAFAASNSNVVSPGFHRDFAFISGGASGSRLWIEQEHMLSVRKATVGFQTLLLPLAASESGGAFGLAARYTPFPHYSVDFMVVGGDYRQPDKTEGTAVFVTKTDQRSPVVRAAETAPHGFRSAVAWDKTAKAWIAVGPNGTDVSFDDGRNWRGLRPSGSDTPDADKGWNALSLPFVVGEKGRIGVLRDGAVVRP